MSERSTGDHCLSVVSHQLRHAYYGQKDDSLRHDGDTDDYSHNLGDTGDYLRHDGDTDNYLHHLGDTGDYLSHSLVMTTKTLTSFLSMVTRTIT